MFGKEQGVFNYGQLINISISFSIIVKILLYLEKIIILVKHLLLG